MSDGRRRRADVTRPSDHCGIGPRTISAHLNGVSIFRMMAWTSGCQPGKSLASSSVVPWTVHDFDLPVVALNDGEQIQ